MVPYGSATLPYSETYRLLLSNDKGEADERHQETLGTWKKSCSNSSYCSESEATPDFGVEGVSKITTPRHCISSQVGALPVWHSGAQRIGQWITNQATSETGSHDPGRNTKDTGQIGPRRTQSSCNVFL